MVVRLTARGMHQGDFSGIPAIGKQAIWSAIHICRMAEGKLAEHWAVVDRHGLLQQLGATIQPS